MSTTILGYTKKDRDAVSNKNQRDVMIMPNILWLGKLRQEVGKFKASLYRRTNLRLKHK